MISLFYFTNGAGGWSNPTADQFPGAGNPPTYTGSLANNQILWDMIIPGKFEDPTIT
jgi:hypothetical protein